MSRERCSAKRCAALRSASYSGRHAGGMLARKRSEEHTSELQSQSNLVCRLLLEKTEKIKSGRVDPRDDNMLKITTEGRKAALDLRLVLPHVRDNPDSNTNKAVEKIHDIWEQSAP